MATEKGGRFSGRFSVRDRLDGLGFSGPHWAAWVISGVGLALAGLSLWYLIVVKALYLGTAFDSGLVGIVLKVIEVTLLASFSLVLVYGGYWLASSPFEKERLWWAGLWTMLGLAGIVALVALVTAFQISQGREISQPTLVQEMLLAAGGGALAGLLIGISTVRETVEAENAKKQRDTLVFVNKLLRHNVLNGMNVILGNTDLLREHVDEEGQRYLDANEDRAETVVDLIQNVRVLMRSVSGEESLRPVSLVRPVRSEVEAIRNAYPEATIELTATPDIEVVADGLLDAVFENLLTNAIEHNDHDEPHVEVTVERRSDHAIVRIADDGPGIPREHRDRLLEAGEQLQESAGHGLGLYLVHTLVERYDGTIQFEDSDPRGTAAVVELPVAR